MSDPRKGCPSRLQEVSCLFRPHPPAKSCRAALGRHRLIRDRADLFYRGAFGLQRCLDGGDFLSGSRHGVPTSQTIHGLAADPTVSFQVPPAPAVADLNRALHWALATTVDTVAMHLHDRFGRFA